MENINPETTHDTPPGLHDTPLPAPVNDSKPDSPPMPELSLWELMRKDDDPSCHAGNDDIDRVLTGTRCSIWDLD